MGIKMKLFRKLLLHLCVACSFAGIIARILDWFNPFMDFSGHMGYVQMLLYTAVILAVVTAKNKKTG